MNRRFYTILICSILLIALMSITGFANNDSTVGNLRKLSTEEIKESALKKLDDSKTNEKTQKNIITPYSSSFYVEWPVSYKADYVKVDKEAFQIAEFTFDTYGHPESYKDVTVTYSGGDTVSWAITGTLEAEAEFSVLSNGVKAKAGVSVNRTSTISNSVQASAPYSIKKNSTGVIPIYAYGYKTVGAMKYKWEDRYGKSGYIYKDIKSYLPYKKYSSSYIKFGRLDYD